MILNASNVLALMTHILVLSTTFSLTTETPVYEPIGCFLDRGISPRPMPLLLKDFRPDMNWNDIASVIEKCASLAHKKSLSYFGLKYYGECWSGETAGQTYSRDGPSDSCIKGVGQRSSYFVYKFFDYGDKSPGCKGTWNGQSGNCFLVMANDSLATRNEITVNCLKNGGHPAKAGNKNVMQLVEQFLYFLKMNVKSSFLRCLVIGDVNASSYSTLPSINGLSIGNVTLTCAVRESNSWKIQLCNGSNCHRLCIAPREINPATGTFVQLATDASIVGHVIKSLLVYDMVTCARECLMYINCLSINYEYKTTTSREFRELGMICELNDDTSSDVPIHQRFGFKYYERFNSNSLYYRDR
ncbi:uncharacterized protein [Montipora capricornis]|uniref:uncharacterized protein n=1 Tax=Montipora capricornis TaxID=246305 RepID=UPI0035F213EF